MDPYLAINPYLSRSAGLYPTQRFKPSERISSQRQVPQATGVPYAFTPHQQREAVLQGSLREFDATRNTPALQRGGQENLTPNRYTQTAIDLSRDPRLLETARVAYGSVLPTRNNLFEAQKARKENHYAVYSIPL